MCVMCLYPDCIGRLCHGAFSISSVDFQNYRWFVFFFIVDKCEFIHMCDMFLFVFRMNMFDNLWTNSHMWQNAWHVGGGGGFFVWFKISNRFFFTRHKRIGHIWIRSILVLSKTLVFVLFLFLFMVFEIIFDNAIMCDVADTNWTMLWEKEKEINEFLLIDFIPVCLSLFIFCFSILIW